MGSLGTGGGVFSAAAPGCARSGLCKCLAWFCHSVVDFAFAVRYSLCGTRTVERYRSFTLAACWVRGDVVA